MVKEIDNNSGLELLKKYFLEEINEEPFNVYTQTIAYIDENILKGLIVYEYIIDRIEIDYVVVDEEYRKNGIASEMLSYLINRYDCSISLEVRADNELAICLYKKHGFYPATIRKGYYGKIDAILMIRE